MAEKKFKDHMDVPPDPKVVKENMKAYKKTLEVNKQIDFKL